MVPNEETVRVMLDLLAVQGNAMQEMDVQAHLVEGMRFDVKAGSGHEVTVDMLDGLEGQSSAGFSPMEMLLVGLAGCTGMSVLSILRGKRQRITGYELRVHGKRADQHPKVFVEISVEHIVTGQGVQPIAVERAIELSETRYCGVEAMLSKTARITHTYRIMDAEL
ncbi:MAG TPA: OsmC family protein [Ktedonobacteraceae bacterium]|nr:OsmC family protein [Ktedonobacteraceae bacterium]